METDGSLPRPGSCSRGGLRCGIPLAGWAESDRGTLVPPVAAAEEVGVAKGAW